LCTEPSICVQFLKLSVSLVLCICLGLAFCVFFCFSSDHFVTACRELRNVLFLALSVTFLFFLFVNQISRKLLTKFALNSHGRCAWSLARWNLNARVKGQGHGTKNVLCTPITPAAPKWNAFATNNVMQQQTRPFRRSCGVISAACVRFMFGKTSLALVLCCLLLLC